jgi:hypothetical protein
LKIVNRLSEDSAWTSACFFIIQTSRSGNLSIESTMPKSKIVNVLGGTENSILKGRLHFLSTIYPDAEPSK